MTAFNPVVVDLNEIKSKLINKELEKSKHLNRQDVLRIQDVSSKIWFSAGN